MPNPQQPEIARSRKSRVTPQPPDERTRSVDVDGDAGPVPPGNRPGRRPKKDQDKPTGPPPTPLPRVTEDHRFRFAFDRLMAPAAAAFGVTPWTAWVDLTPEALRIRFGPWSVEVPRDQVTGAEVTGPYTLLKVAGPPRLSLADRGVTFATNRRAGVCIQLAQPVAALLPAALARRLPIGQLRHPALTVTVDDPEELARLLGGP